MQWSAGEDAALLGAVKSGWKRSEVAAHLTGQFGRQITAKAVERRLFRLARAGAKAKWEGEMPPIEWDVPIEWNAEPTAPPVAQDASVARIAQQVTPAQRPPPDRSFVDMGEPSYEFEPLDLGSRTHERVLVIPDTHAPFHDPRAWRVVMNFARAWQPDTVLHVGDFPDCFTISDHDKDPRRAGQLEDELKITRELRAEVESLRSVQRKIISLGNHEYRLERYMMKNAPALISLLDIAQLLELPQHGWSVVPYKSHGRLGKMYFTHDAEHAGVHAVHHTGNAFCSSVLFGHTHRLGASYFGDVTGRRHVSASLGWLGLLREAKYKADILKRFWTHGFGVVEMNARGLFQLQLIPIVEYRCVLNGQTISL